MTLKELEAIASTTQPLLLEPSLVQELCHFARLGIDLEDACREVGCDRIHVGKRVIEVP